jgi:WD40 repeat protein
MLVADPNGHIEGPERRFLCVTGLACGGIVAGDDGGDLTFLDPEGRAVSSVRAHRGSVRCVVELPDGRLATGGDDFAVRVWERFRDHPASGIHLDARPKQIVAISGGILVIDMGGRFHALIRSGA